MKVFFTSQILMLILFVNTRSYAAEFYEVTNDVFVRSGIGSSYEAIGVSKEGDQLNVLDKSNPKWFKIEFEDKIGYISSKFLKISVQPIPDAIVETVAEEEKESYSGAALLILFLVLFLILEISRRRRNKRIAKSINNFQNSHPQLFQKPKNIRVEDERLSQITHRNNRKEIKTATINHQENKLNDDKMVLAKKESSTPNEYNRADKVMNKAPFWPERFIFSPSAIDDASKDQKSFYWYFKQKFLDDVFLDLNGNNNYAFVLLHDLLAEYETRLDIKDLTTQITNLTFYYSKTKFYATGYLNKIKRELGTTAEEHSDMGIAQSSEPTVEREPEDESIIDVTTNFSKSQPIPVKVDEAMMVPAWNHRYVYSKSDLNHASSEQKKFYRHFKQKFLEGISLDIMGNTNYAFVLLFDLLDDYRSHTDISVLESQINNLGNNFYKTRSYGIRFLNDIKKELGLIHGLDNKYGQRIEIKVKQENYYDSEPDYVYWKVGSKYKDKLGLNDEEVALLNKLWESTTNFCGIEFCYFQVIKVYLLVILEFKEQSKRDESSLDEEFLSVSDLIARRHFRYRKGSANYKMSIRNTSDEFYATIFKLCENAVREHYGHRRKLNTESYYADPQIKVEFNARITSPFSALISTNIFSVLDPDQETEKELNSLNTSRWKDTFQRICTDFSSDEKKFVAEIIKLGDLNTKNPSIENIFYDASKFIASKHKESSLILYMHYLHHDLKSVKFDNKQLTKTIQRNLFKTQEQIEQFATIVSSMLKDQDLEKAVAAVSQLYAIKRKRIKLDRNSIEEVRQQHVGTVELLNEYLQDEEEQAVVEFKEGASETEDIEIQFNPIQQPKKESMFLEEIEFKPIHYSALELFAKNNFAVPIKEFELFSKSNGVFPNQLIESINEACYEVLDDVLIEKDEDYYTIEVTYFQAITTQGS